MHLAGVCPICVGEVPCTAPYPRASGAPNTHRIAEGNPISEAAEEEKLRLVADVAHAAWG